MSAHFWKILKYSPNGVDTYNVYPTKEEADRECDALNARPANGYNVYKVEHRDSANLFFEARELEPITWTIDAVHDGREVRAYSSWYGRGTAEEAAAAWLKHSESLGYAYPGWTFTARTYIVTALDRYGVGRGG